MKYIFNKDALRVKTKVSDLLMEKGSIMLSKTANDIMMQTTSVEIDVFMLKRLADVKTVFIKRQRQSFWKWLTEKEQEFEFTINCTELMTNPPTLPDNIFIYEVDSLE